MSVFLFVVFSKRSFIRKDEVNPVMVKKTKSKLNFSLLFFSLGTTLLENNILILLTFIGGRFSPNYQLLFLISIIPYTNPATSKKYSADPRGNPGGGGGGGGPCAKIPNGNNNNVKTNNLLYFLMTFDWFYLLDPSFCKKSLLIKKIFY